MVTNADLEKQIDRHTDDIEEHRERIAKMESSIVELRVLLDSNMHRMQTIYELHSNFHKEQLSHMMLMIKELTEELKSRQNNCNSHQLSMAQLSSRIDSLQADKDRKFKVTMVWIGVIATIASTTATAIISKIIGMIP